MKCFYQPISKIIIPFMIIIGICMIGCKKKNDSEEIKYGSIQGIVTDGVTGEPIHAVNIKLSPTGSSTVTGTDGRYEFHNLEAGVYTVQATKSGYQTNTQQVTVTVDNIAHGDMVINAVSSSMSLNMSQLNFGTVSTSMNFRVKNIGGAGTTVNWRITENADWLTCNPMAGSAVASSYSEVTVTIDRNLFTTDVSTNIAIINNEDGSIINLPAYASVSGGGGGGGDDDEIVVPNGLLSYYTFNNENGNDLTDNAMHGNLVNAPTFIDNTPNGKGKAVFLNATTNQYFNIPYNQFNERRTYSVCFWIKDFSEGILFATSPSGSNNISNIYPRLYCTNNNTFQTRLNYYTLTEFDFSYNNADIQYNGWHHVCMVVEASNVYPYTSGTAKLFVDGALIDTQSVSSIETSTGASIQFGSGTFDFLKTSMKIDNIRFYSRGLSNNEVNLIYNTELQ